MSEAFGGIPDLPPEVVARLSAAFQALADETAVRVFTYLRVNGETELAALADCVRSDAVCFSERLADLRVSIERMQAADLLQLDESSGSTTVRLGEGEGIELLRQFIASLQ